MRRFKLIMLTATLGPTVLLDTGLAKTGDTESISAGAARATIVLVNDAGLRTYELSTTASLRDNKPPEKQITISEAEGHPVCRTGSLLFDGLYAMAVSEALQNSVGRISDGAYEHGTPVEIEAYQTGELWSYVWTRDLSYSLDLSLAAFDPKRAVNSLLFKASALKPSVSGELKNQIVQDTGSGGSYPVSTDRVVWALGAMETLKNLSGGERRDFLEKVYPVLRDTIEQDRRLVFDARDGLYRGEQSFLDWREQTYPCWTKDNVLAIAMSKALSVNCADYFLLNTASELAGEMKDAEAQARYKKWADDLRAAINRRMYDPHAGLYRTYLFSEDGSNYTPVARYDLLGESLAILCGVADEAQARSVIANYPTGPYGPPVVWPEERDCRIYHNQAMWPFVTAYWIKAARKAGNAAAVDAGIQSLQQLAALNLSNMENFDFVTMHSHVEEGPRTGPVINSRRQLWSVAGYLSMVQSVVFGQETSWEGVRFAPCITAKLRNETFRAADVIELRGVNYLGTRNTVRVHLPPAGSFAQGVCALDHVQLNGTSVTPDFIPAASLKAENFWDIYLKPPAQGGAPSALRTVANVADERSISGPAAPQWQDAGQNGLTLEMGRVVLNFKHEDAANVVFDIYRDGQLCAQGIRQTKWMDPASGDYQSVVHAYAVEAVDAVSGNVSHLSQARSYRTDDQQQVIAAKDLHNEGGELVDGKHFENWGKPGDTLASDAFRVNHAGRFLVRAEFSNGSGPVSTGITCAVKRLEIRKAGSGAVVAAGYLVMPQSGDWERYDLSSAVEASLDPGQDYELRLCEDEYCRNMSYFGSNTRYTAGPGGGEESSNYVNISAVRLLYSGPASTATTAGAGTQNGATRP